MLLTKPTATYSAQFKRFAQHYLDSGEMERAGKYAAGITGFPEYLQSLQDASRGIGLPEGYLPYQTFWLIEEDQLVGVVRVRPTLTPHAEKYDGHIGYDIVPTERCKGYGTTLLRMALVEARQLGLPSIILTCLTANLPSQRTIEKAGGRFLEVVTDYETGRPLHRYEVPCPPLPISKP
ncbi:GNAT family N-acetyltransferase [Granulicella arctica]|uniref:Putative acetyltransferase n=1 Tax=Granulicella arctica TaxID=940613 RepID=A0A7Y9PIX1_9BACT|nr:GNAT family N-acetyltransferase [Granulicella arctica]NYF79956.1 putative acetyltransferase [Granulicella arctica]